MPRHRGVQARNFFGLKSVSVKSAARLARSFYESLPDDIGMSSTIVIAIAPVPSGQRRDLVGVIIAPAGAVQSHTGLLIIPSDGRRAA
jgi:hypothetical protein